MIASTTQPPLWPMDKLFKGQKQKGPKVLTSPSTSTLNSAEPSELPIERIDWALEIAGIVKDISEASPLLVPLKASCLLIIRGLEVARVMVLLRSALFSSYASIQEMHQNRLDLQDITEVLKKQEKDMEAFAVRLERGDMNGSPLLQSKLEIYLKNIHEALVEMTAPVKETKHQRFDLLRRPCPTTSTQVEIPTIKQKLNSSYQDFMDSALFIASEKVEERASLAMKMHEVSGKAEYLNKQEQLEDEPEYDYDSPLPLLYGHGIPCCQPGTRTVILADINQWAMDTRTNGKIYWLKDAAGTGKTTVAATCARDWQVKQTLAGRFFFTPNSKASSGIDRFCTTVAKDIAFLVPSIDGVITAVLDELSRRRCGFHEQFERLIVKPLRSAKLSHPVVLIFDALDNCDPDGRRILLNCLLEHLPNISHVKVLLTSRPSPDIVNILSTSIPVRGQEVQLLDIHDEVRTDVRIYVHSILNRLDNQEREKVVEYSGGLFIVAATACRMLRLSRQPGKLLNKLLNSNSKDHLDELYLEALRQAIWNAGTHEKMMSVLQIIIATFQPVSINTIAYFLAAKFDVGKFVQDLAAVLKDGHPERPIKVLHPTFREFLANFERANGFMVSKSSSHSLTAIGCLDTLEKLLRYDTLGLHSTCRVIPRNSDVGNLEKRVNTTTTAAVRYASSYWAYHVAASQNDPKVWLRALDFLSAKLLNWIELMSWRGSLADCVQGLSQLRVHVLPALRGKQGILEKAQAVRIVHAYHFLLQHQPILQASALHTYSAALAFTPKSSPLFENYRQEYISKIPGVISTTPYEWPTHDVLTGHDGFLQQLEFCPDGSRFATRADDCTMIMWDPSSGATVGFPFRGAAEDRVEYLAFSLDSQKVAFATKSSKVYLWNALDGHKVLEIADAGPGEIVQIGFSPTDPYIISASTSSRDYEEAGDLLRLWSTINGQAVGPSMRLHGGARCFAISPDGLRVACVSKHKFEGGICVVTLWSLDTFMRFDDYDMPITYATPCIAYSPRGNRFVSWSHTGVLYLRDGHTGASISSVETPHKPVDAVKFSPDGILMASYGGGDPTVDLRSAIDGGLMVSLVGHVEEIRYISFSQDGKRLASISLDQTIRVWETVTGTSMESFFTGYTGTISDPVLSPDWSKLVTVSIGNQINFYDFSDGSLPGYETKGEDMDFAAPNVAFAPSGDLVACGYLDLDDTATLNLWTLEPYNTVGFSMLGHRGGISSVAFSPDGSMVASASKDGTVRLWHTSTGLPIGDSLPMTDGQYVTISPDNYFLASSSFDSIQVWEIHSRRNVWSIDRGCINYLIAFSPRLSQIFGGLESKLCVWDFTARASMVPVITSASGIRFDLLALSPANDLVASCCHDKIQLWRAASELQLLAEIPIKPNRMFQLGMSRDGKYLAYGSSIWDISSSPNSLVPLDYSQKPYDSIERAFSSHSLLTYDNGWIRCPLGELMPVPGDLWDQFRVWHALGRKVVTWTQQRSPLVIDCSNLINPSV